VDQKLVAGLLASQPRVSSPPIAVLIIVSAGELVGSWANVVVWRWTSYVQQPRRDALIRTLPFSPAGPAALLGWTGMTLAAWAIFVASHLNGAAYNATLFLAIFVGGGAAVIGCILSVTAFLWGRPKRVIPPKLRDLGGLLGTSGRSSR